MISIFTPTFNRAYILSSLYNSLINQTDSDFEWIIVDDGSTDNTEQLVNSWILENKLKEINYIKTPNQGKTTAINIGLQHAKGELFFIVDSDDYITDNAIEEIKRKDQSLNKDLDFKVCGICFKKRHYNTNKDFTSYDGNLPAFASALELAYKYKQTGDKAEVYYTDVLKKYPFPVLENNKFIPESYIWFKMAHDGYKLALSDKAIYICEYMEDGYTKNLTKLIKNNYRGFALYHKSRLKYSEVPLKVKVKSLIRLLQCKIYGVFYK